MKLLRKKDVAKLFGNDLATVDRWHRAGSLPVARIKIGGLVYYDEAEILKVLKERGLILIASAA